MGIIQALFMVSGVTVLDPAVVGTGSDGTAFFRNSSGLSGVYALVGPWPSGATINSATGVISGAPAPNTYCGLQVSFTLSNGVVFLTPPYCRAWVSTAVVISLVRGNGTDLSTTFTDQVAGGSWLNRESPYGDSIVSSTRSKWGGTSIRQDNDDIIRRTDGLTNFTLSGDFTIEAWVFIDEATTFAFGRLICGLYNNTTNEGVTLLARSEGPGLIFYNDAPLYHTAGASLTGRWAHIHCGRAGLNLYAGSDGSTTSVATTSAPSR